MKPLNVAIVGCGVIAGPYSKDILTHPELKLVGFYDLDPARAEKHVAEYGGRVFGSYEEVLAAPDVGVVVNLTIHHAHYAVVKQALEAGKHVYSEKPLAMSYREAAALVQLAQERGLRLACAPIVFLGEAQQTAMRWVREGKLGTVRMVYAEVNHGRIEVWHPAPQPFYEVGPLFDVGVYPLTILTALFGPARRVSAYGTTLKPDRLTKRGVPFRVEGPDYLVLHLEFEGGPVVRLTANFYVSHRTVQGEGVEFHGDAGSLHLVRWFERDARLEYADFEKPYEPVPLDKTPERGFDWSAGLLDMAEAIAQDRPQRVTGAQAAHVVEIQEAAYRSIETGRPVELTSSFAVPAPMPYVAAEQA